MANEAPTSVQFQFIELIMKRKNERKTWAVILDEQVFTFTEQKVQDLRRQFLHLVPGNGSIGSRDTHIHLLP